MARRPLLQRPLRALAKLAPKTTGSKAPRTAKPSQPPEQTFAEAMRRAGAVPLAPSAGRVLAAKPHRSSARTAAFPCFRLEARDGFIEGQRARLATRELARLHGPPEATLDLHRKSAESARALLAAFLEQERAKGRQRVLVIVGKGRHSAGGFAVLRSEIGDWLSEPPLSAHVLAFATARPELGGTGCLSLLLAPKAKR
jgi:DNA-nicking Smr family endonuclease